MRFFYLYIFILIFCVNSAWAIVAPVGFYNCSELLSRVIRMKSFNEVHFVNLYLKYTELFYLDDEEFAGLIHNKYGPIPPRNLIEVADQLIDELRDELLEVGVRSQVVTETLEVPKGMVPINFRKLRVDLRSEMPTQHSLLMIKKLQHAFGVDSILIDPIESFNEQFDAQYFQREIEINIGAFIEKLLDNRVGRVVTHEFTHAKFSQGRINGHASLFDSVFYGKLKKFTHQETESYSGYFSFEELYDYTRDLNNGMREFASQLNGNTIRWSDFTEIEESLKGINGVAYQTSMISRATMKGFKDLESSNNLFYGREFRNDDSSFEGVLGLAVKFENFEGSFFLNSYQQSIFDRYKANYKVVDEYLKGSKNPLLKGGMKELKNGDVAKVLDNVKNRFIVETYYSLLHDQRLILGSLYAQQSQALRVAQNIFLVTEELNESFFNLIVFQKNIKLKKTVDKEALANFNVEYKKIRVAFRELAQMVMAAEGSP